MPAPLVSAPPGSPRRRCAGRAGARAGDPLLDLPQMARGPFRFRRSSIQQSLRHIEVRLTGPPSDRRLVPIPRGDDVDRAGRRTKRRLCHVQACGGAALQRFELDPEVGLAVSDCQLERPRRQDLVEHGAICRAQHAGEGGIGRPSAITAPMHRLEAHDRVQERPPDGTDATSAGSRTARLATRSGASSEKLHGDRAPVGVTRHVGARDAEVSEHACYLIVKGAVARELPA